MLQRFSENHWQPLTAFPLKVLDIVSNSGICTGFTASSHRGSILKGTKVSNLYEYFIQTFLQFWEFLGLPSYIAALIISQKFVV